MYEEMTYEVIMQKMLERVPNTFDKREGSIIFDALAPAAAELAQLYIALDVVLDQTFADTATNEYLEKRCEERGIFRKLPTCAVVQGSFTPTDADVLGKRFSCGSYNYVVTEATATEGVYLLACETSGEMPNAVLGKLIPIEYIPGLQMAVLEAVLVPGVDAEDDENLRERYFDSIRNQAFGGNVADYKAKTKAIAGVAGVKVTPVWNGGGTVKLTILGDNAGEVSEDFIAMVQKEITEIAPIGHVVTVEGAVAIPINIVTTITYVDGNDWETSGEAIFQEIETYLLSLKEKWEDEEKLIVRVSGVERAILSCPNILDVQNTSLNGASGNLQLAAYEFPVGGEFSDGS